MTGPGDSIAASFSNYAIVVTMFDKYYHNIILGKIKIRVPLPPLYVRKVWNYNQANLQNIKKAISNFNLSKAFEDLCVDGKVERLNETRLK